MPDDRSNEQHLPPPPGPPGPAGVGGASPQVTQGSWTGAPVGEGRDALVGAVLGDTYRILRVLGEGGMGRVYEAQHTRIDGKRFAVKVLHAELVRSQEVRVRFHREAEAAALIDHPNALGVYDVGETRDGRAFLVAELLSGEDLSDRLVREGTLPVPLAVRVVRQVAGALGAAHRRGVVHRDVKPDNVFLIGDPAAPVAKVLDFGISRLRSAGVKLTKAGTVMGTPSYMPPEQARGQGVDHRADIYGLGAILYRALTGCPPHDQGNSADTLIDLLTQELVSPRFFDESIPEALEQIILRAMAREAADRFATMEEFDAALAAYDTSATAVALPPAALGPVGGLAAGTRIGTGTRGPVGSALAPTILKRSLAEVARGRDEVDGRPAGAPLDSHQADLLLLATVAVVGLFLLLHAAVAAVVLLARGGVAATLGRGEAIAIAFAVSALLAGILAVAVVRYRTSWRQPGLAHALAGRVRGPLVVALGCYGLLAALVPVVETTFLGRPLGAAWPAWSLLLPLVSLAMGAATAFFPRRIGDSLRPATRLGLVGAAAVLAVIVVVAALVARGEIRP